MFTMKNIMLFVSLFICSSFVVSAQNSLGFSQVKLISSLDTVPLGKVWKIEGFVYSQPVVLANQDASILINGIPVAVRSSRYNEPHWIWAVCCGTGGVSSPQFEIWEQKNPIWLPSSSILNIGPGVTFISVLEFEIDP